MHEPILFANDETRVSNPHFKRIETLQSSSLNSANRSEKSERFNPVRNIQLNSTGKAEVTDFKV